MTDVTDADGDSLIWYSYRPFGELRSFASTSQAPVNPFRFSGEYQGLATGLYHLRARQYDPATGRFLTTDPVAAPIADPYAASYVYAKNNPLTFVDPTGNASEKVTFLDPEREILGCAAGGLGFGIGLIVAGSLLEVGGGFLEIVSAGGLTPVAGASIIVGTGDIAAGQVLIREACGLP